MRIVFLSGGSGKRLWPLSNEIRSKLFLKLLPGEEEGLESMIQRVCRQLDTAGLLQATTIVTHRDQREITRTHVGAAIPIVAETHKQGLPRTRSAWLPLIWQQKQRVGPR